MRVTRVGVLAVVTALICLSGRPIQHAAAVAATPAIDGRVTATFVAGALSLRGASLGATGDARSIQFDYDGKTTTVSASDERVASWSPTAITLTLPPEVHSGTLRVSVNGAASAPVKLLVFMYSGTSTVIAGTSGKPLAIATAADGSLWINEEYHNSIKRLMPGDPSTVSSYIIPQAPGAGIFAQNIYGDSPSRVSALNEDIKIAPDGAVWFSEGGGYLYDGPSPNMSRIIRFNPSDNSFRCYNIPTDHAEVAGFLLDLPGDSVWYSESNLISGNAIGRFRISESTPDCDATPSDPPSPYCTTPRVAGCHDRWQLPNPASAPGLLAAAPDGTIWFSEFWGNRLGRIDPRSGAISQLPLPPPIVTTGYVGSGPWYVAFDAKGDLWVTEYFDAKVLHVRPSLMSQFDCSQLDASKRNPCVTDAFVGSDGSDGATVHSLTVGADGYVWFGWSGQETRLGFIDPGNNDAVVLLPAIAGMQGLAALSQDPVTKDVWFAQYFDDKIGRLQFASGDADGVPDALDNCPTVYNPDQANGDRNFIDLAPWGKPFNDLTRPMSDNLGDACDPDMDNDGLTNDAESQIQPGGAMHAACPAASAATDPGTADSDGDLVLDGAECALGTDPANAASVPPRAPAGDTDRDGLTDAFERAIGTDPARSDSDGDGVGDGVEYKYYGTNPLAKNSDGDQCNDAMEIASVNGDPRVTAVDLLIVAMSYSTREGPKYVPDFDMNKDGAINAIDLQFVLSRFGNCQ